MNKQEKLEKACYKDGYHTWCSKKEGTTFDSDSEDYYEISGNLTCQACGATAWVSGNWDVTYEPEE